MLDFSPDLYEPQPGDVYVTLLPGPEGGEGAKVNLNAITYYAKIGMKPKGIHALVGTTAMTIFNNPKLREAYEAGKAFHQLWLRGAAMAQAQKNGFLADALLSRSGGKHEADALEGEDPGDRQVTTEQIKVVLEVEDTKGDPEIEALKKLLDDRVAESVAKDKK